jgi:hypothetical protein
LDVAPEDARFGSVVAVDGCDVAVAVQHHRYGPQGNPAKSWAGSPQPTASQSIRARARTTSRIRFSSPR